MMISWALILLTFSVNCVALLNRTSGDMQVPDDKLQSIRYTLEPFLKKGSLVLSSYMRPLCFYRHSQPRNTPSEFPLLKVKGAVILCVSAVGCPQSLDLVLIQVLTMT